MNKEKAIRRQKDAAFIQDPGEWPRWPVLPLKRRDGKWEESIGVLYAQMAPPYKVYLAYLWEIGMSDPRPKTWEEALAKYNTKEYATLDELLDTWTVD